MSTKKKKTVLSLERQLNRQEFKDKYFRYYVLLNDISNKDQKGPSVTIVDKVFYSFVFKLLLPS